VALLKTEKRHRAHMVISAKWSSFEGANTRQCWWTRGRRPHQPAAGRVESPEPRFERGLGPNMVPASWGGRSKGGDFDYLTAAFGQAAGEAGHFLRGTRMTHDLSKAVTRQSLGILVTPYDTNGEIAGAQKLAHSIIDARAPPPWGGGILVVKRQHRRILRADANDEGLQRWCARWAQIG